VPRLSPFRALRYAPALGPRLPRLLAPPYDVLSPEERARLAADPLNIVHLDLPVAEEGLDPYQAAARRLRSWVDEGILARDERPAVHVLEHTYRTGDGEPRVRRGFFARLLLEPLDGGRVIPHERTLLRPRADRERLLAATRTHLSAVFLLHPDDRGAVVERLREASRGQAAADMALDDGTRVRGFTLGERDTAPLLEGLADSWCLIADGHHRYESALAYRDLRRSQGARDAETVLAFLCSLEDPGLTILPIHRRVHSIEPFSPEAFREALASHFDLQPIARVADLPAAAASDGRPGVFGLRFRGESGAWVARWRPGSGLEAQSLRSLPEPLRRLDVILLHRLVFEEVLGISPEAQAREGHLEYVKDRGELLRDDARSQVAVLMNATPIDQVLEVTRSGLRLPQKTTYFHPKVPTGLVLDPLDQAPTSEAPADSSLPA